MPGNFHGWLYAQDRQGNAYEVINQSRTASYLQNDALRQIEEVSICDVLDFGGCTTYPLGPDNVVASGGYIDFPGTSGNYVTIPSGSVAATPGNLTIIVAVAMDDWTPASASSLISRWTTTGNQRGWFLQLSAAGVLNFSWSTDGVGTGSETSSLNLAATANGDKVWIAVTLDANVTAGTQHSVRFFTSPDEGVTWTQFGTTKTAAPAVTIHPSTAPIMLGSMNTGTATLTAGNMYYASVATGYAANQTPGGNVVFEYDGGINLLGSTSATTSFVTTTGDVATVAKSGSPSTLTVPPVYRCDLVPLTFDEPATDGCPWYDPDRIESAEAYGIYVNEWTGLDDGHIRRDNRPRGSGPGGATLGVLGGEGRTMALNVMLFASTAGGMEHLFRWLSNTLNNICSTCTTNRMLFRRICGTPNDLPWEGIGELREVGIVQGLKWESDVGRRARCYIRRASFTLMAGDPCIYLPGTDVPVHVDNFDANLPAFLTASADDTRTICRPSCSELTTNSRLSRTFDVTTTNATSLVVTWENTSSTYTYPFRAVVYYDPLGVGTDDPNPCGLQIAGELYVRAMPPASAMRWDVTGRTVAFRDQSTGGWTPTWTYVDANDPPLRRFFILPCGTSHLVMEPASMCASSLGGSNWELDGVEFSPVAYPTPSLVLSERVSCV